MVTYHCPSVSVWNLVLKRESVPTWWNNSFQNPLGVRASPSDIITLSKPWYLNTLSMNKRVHFSSDNSYPHQAKWTTFQRRSTNTLVAVFASDSCNLLPFPLKKWDQLQDIHFFPLVWCCHLTDRTKSHIFTHVTPHTSPSEPSFKAVHSTIKYHMSNERDIVLLLYNLLSQDFRYYLISLIIFSTVQNPLRGYTQFLTL